ncbi:MAG: asparagine synthase (glutamine-hydrolyzing) [Gemmatimonadaceae bacterium]
MCGIAGIVTSENVPANEGVVAAMTAALGHRGPDGHGGWCDTGIALGHRRLSIIDLTDAGQQPMLDESGRYVLVYNGEIYNYLELRRELEDKGYRFRSHTDSEVLLNAYREWDVGALERFNGMWAFAIWDRERRELFASRDRAGKKPFYYALGEAGAFYFASEIKALRAAGFSFGLNPQAAFDFLTQGTYGHLEGRGFFDGVAQLPAAHWMRVQAGKPPVMRRYWELPVVSERDRLPYDGTLRSRFRDLFTDAVRLRLRSDVPIGATLSGGLDSSTIVGVVDQLSGGAPIHLFTSLYPGTDRDETPFFEAVVHRLRSPIIHRVTPSADDALADLPEVLDHQEEPFGDTSIFAHYHLMRAARSAGIPVILSGQGGDELLMGYPSMVNAFLGSLIGTGQLLRARREIESWARFSAMSRGGVLRSVIGHALPLDVRDLVRERFVRRMAAAVSPALATAASFRRFEPDSGRSSFDRYIAQVFTRFSIPHLTHYDDRNAMAFSVEGRMPFLDYRIVELLFSVADDALFANGMTKRLLRDSFADLLPEKVRNRTDKVGFYTPLAVWLRGEAQGICGLMTRDRIEYLNVLRPERYLERLEALLHGDDGAALEVWRGYVFHLWADRFTVLPFESPGWPRRFESRKPVRMADPTIRTPERLIAVESRDQ